MHFTNGGSCFVLRKFYLREMKYVFCVLKKKLAKMWVKCQMLCVSSSMGEKEMDICSFSNVLVYKLVTV